MEAEVQERRLSETAATREEQTVSFPVREKPKIKKIGQPSDWRAWFIERKNAGEVATLIGGHPGDRTVNIQPSQPEWEGDTSWPIALGYPWVRWDEPYIGNQPKAADGSIAARDNMAPVEMGRQPTLVANLPFKLKLIGNEYAETGCAIYVREDVYGAA